jgi:hypothetical protein
MATMTIDEAQALDVKRKRANSRFNRMTPAQKRVTIAKDVLKLLRQKRVKVRQGNWVRSPELEGLMKDKPYAQLDSILPVVRECEACAVGAMFLATVSRCNDFSVGDYYKAHIGTIGLNASPRFEQLANYLGQFFSLRQLGSIEAVFEGHIDSTQFRAFPSGIPQAVRRAVERVAKENAKDRDPSWETNADARRERAGARLVRIMKNIIKNNGTFKP